MKFSYELLTVLINSLLFSRLFQLNWIFFLYKFPNPLEEGILEFLLKKM